MKSQATSASASLKKRNVHVVAAAVVVAVRRNLPKRKKKKKKNPAAAAAMAKKAAVAAVDRGTIITINMRKLQQQVRTHAVVEMAAVASKNKEYSCLGLPRLEFLFPR